MSKAITSKAEKTVEAFYQSLFTTYLNLDFIKDFIASIGGAALFLEHVDVFITDDANIDSLSDSWTDSSLVLFDKYRAVCVDSAAYWEFDGDRAMTIERLNGERRFDVMLMTLNRQLRDLYLGNNAPFNTNQVKSSLSNKTPHHQRDLLDKLVAAYCVRCTLALSCWGFKGFLREGGAG